MKETTNLLDRTIPSGIIELPIMRKRLIKLYAVIFSIGIPYLIFVLITGIRIPCIIYELTGIPCPGCGITRMYASLARLDFAQSFAYHPVFFVSSFYWVIVSFFAFLGKPEFCRNKRFLTFSLLLMTFFVSIFGIFRLFY